LIPAIVLLTLCGGVLMMYGGIKAFRQSGNLLNDNNLANNLGPFANCGSRADKITGVSDTVRDKVAGRCRDQRAPFWYLFITTSILTLLTPLFACLMWKRWPGLVNFLNIYNAVTLALQFVSIYAMLRAISGSLSNSVDCTGMSSADVTALQGRGFYCNPMHRNIWRHELTPFFVGTAASILGNGLFAWLLSRQMARNFARDKIRDRSREFDFAKERPYYQERLPGGVVERSYATPGAPRVQSVEVDMHRTEAPYAAAPAIRI